MNNNKRLTYHEPDGRFGVAGMNETNKDQKIYACIAKLKDYEDLGLQPSELEDLLGRLDCMSNAQKIRRMSDEDLLEYFSNEWNAAIECNEKYCPKYNDGEFGECNHTSEDCKKALKTYLNSEAE